MRLHNDTPPTYPIGVCHVGALLGIVMEYVPLCLVLWSATTWMLVADYLESRKVTVMRVAKMKEACKKSFLQDNLNRVWRIGFLQVTLKDGPHNVKPHELIQFMKANGVAVRQHNATTFSLFVVR